jgi:hypothetical protein
MAEKTVILIHCDEDGDKFLRVLSEGAFLKELNDGDFGDDPTFAKPGDEIKMDYFCGYILIKGEIVQPRPVEKVKKYAL